MIDKMFKNAVKPLSMGALALTLVATPAFAGKDFYKKDMAHEEIRVAQLVGQEISQHNLTFVVHGGTRDQKMAAYEVAQELDDEGKPMALILAADSDKNPDTVRVEIFSKGGTQYAVFSHKDTVSIEDYKEDIRAQADKAYNTSFIASVETTAPITGALAANYNN